jgi:hypothetical protein
VYGYVSFALLIAQTAILHHVYTEMCPPCTLAINIPTLTGGTNSKLFDSGYVCVFEKPMIFGKN